MADIRPNRLSLDEYALNFADSHPPLTPAQALVESDRCFFCYDSPCVQACPTGIDIPSFIRKIGKGDPKGAAKDILTQNIMGAVCARVCPTEVLCEGSCVRTAQEERPVRIGALQRYATDWLFDAGVQLFKAGPASGKPVRRRPKLPSGFITTIAMARSKTLPRSPDWGGACGQWG